MLFPPEVTRFGTIFTVARKDVFFASRDSTYRLSRQLVVVHRVIRTQSLALKLWHRTTTDDSDLDRFELSRTDVEDVLLLRSATLLVLKTWFCN